MKVVGKVLKTLEDIWDVILILGIVGILLIRVVPIPLGYTPIVCISNSMTPTFSAGSLVYIDRNYDVNSVEEGDIIAYKLSNGTQVTHRVHSITSEGIITKGDANDDVDFSPVSKDQIIGENVLQIPYIGNLFYGFPNILMISIVSFALLLKLFLSFTSTILLKDTEGGSLS